MKKRIEYHISHDDLVAFLGERGINVADQSMSFYSDNEDTGRVFVDFPIIVSWIEEIKVQGNGPRPLGVNDSLPYDTANEAGEEVRAGNRIAAIRAIRAGTGCDLYTAKQWLDHNYPPPRTSPR